MFQIKNFFANKSKLTYIWGLIFIFGFINILFGAGKESLWYDESYSAAIIHLPFWDVLKVTASDNHPPLYYWGLKSFCFLFGNSEASLRLFSAIGCAFLSFLGIGPVKRALGNKTGLIFSILVLFSPGMLSMAQEARMYTWLAFFVTASICYGYLCIVSNKKSDWIKFSIASICSAYTHYYGLLAVIIFNLLLLICILIKKRKLLLTYIKYACLMILCFSPWCFITITRIKAVSKDYWIPPVSLSTLLDSIVSFSVHKSLGNDNIVAFLPYVFMPIWVVLIIKSLSNGIKDFIKNKYKEILLPIMAFLVYSLTLTAAYVASVLIIPVYVTRYSMSITGLLLLCFAYMMSRFKKGDLIIMGIILLIVTIPVNIDYRTNLYNGPMREITTNLKGKVKPGDVFLHTSELTMGTFCYYFPKNKNIMYLGKPIKCYSNCDAFKTNGMTTKNIDATLKNHKTIWLVTTPSGDESMAQIWIDQKKLKIVNDFETFRQQKAWFVVNVAKTQVNR